MERQSKGLRDLEAYCSGSQGPPRAVAPTDDDDDDEIKIDVIHKYWQYLLNVLHLACSMGQETKHGKLRQLQNSSELRCLKEMTRLLAVRTYYSAT